MVVVGGEKNWWMRGEWMKMWKRVVEDESAWVEVLDNGWKWMHGAGGAWIEAGESGKVVGGACGWRWVGDNG